MMFHRLKILLRTSIVGLTLLIAACTPSHSPEESIQLFYESLNQQNYPELLSLFNLEEKLKDPEAEAEAYEILTIIFTDLALNIQEKGGINKIEYHTIEYNSEKDRAIVRYTLYYNDGDYQFDTLALTKDHTGFWQLTIG